MNSRNVIRNLGLGLVAGALLLAGTSSVTAAPDRASAPDSRPSDYRVIATLEQGGATFEFVQANGVIGVAEYAPVGTPSLLQSRGTEGATALEVFLALAGPGASAPQSLVDDHKESVKLSGRQDTAPRGLDLKAPSGPQLGVGTDEYIGDECYYDEQDTPGFSEFTWAWYWGLGIFKDFTAQMTYQFEDLNGTAGKFWYAGKTSQRWLAACNGNVLAGFMDFEFHAETKNASGDWVVVYNRLISPNFKVTYTSFAPGNQYWRVHLKEQSFNVFLNRVYAVAVAGNEPIDSFKAGN